MCIPGDTHPHSRLVIHGEAHPTSRCRGLQAYLPLFKSLSLHILPDCRRFAIRWEHLQFPQQSPSQVTFCCNLVYD